MNAIFARRLDLVLPDTLSIFSSQVRLGGKSYQCGELPNVKQKRGVSGDDSLEETEEDEMKYGALGTSPCVFSSCPHFFPASPISRRCGPGWFAEPDLTMM